MAQRCNFEIPARFVFRPYSARWVVGSLELRDWASLEPIDVELHSHDPKMRGVAPLDLVEAVLKLPSDRGLAKAESPSHTWRQHPVKLSRSALPPGVIHKWENPRPKSDISGRSFEVLVHADPNIRESLWRPKPGESVKDPWEMRDDFVNLPDGIDNLQKFLNQWGIWDRGIGQEVGFADTPAACLIIYPHILWNLQTEFRNALTSGSRRWLSKASLFLKKLSVPPYFTVEESFCLSAIRSTITVDHLAKAQFGICKRHDCRRLFERVSKQKRVYCNQACAHLASVREQRKRAKTRKRSKLREEHNYAKSKRT